MFEIFSFSFFWGRGKHFKLLTLVNLRSELLSSLGNSNPKTHFAFKFNLKSLNFPTDASTVTETQIGEGPGFDSQGSAEAPADSVLRKNARIAISRKRHFRSPKRKNGDHFYRPNYPPKCGKTHLRNHFWPLESGFFGHCYVQNVRFLKTL